MEKIEKKVLFEMDCDLRFTLENPLGVNKPKTKMTAEFCEKVKEYVFEAPIRDLIDGGMDVDGLNKRLVREWGPEVMIDTHAALRTIKRVASKNFNAAPQHTRTTKARDEIISKLRHLETLKERPKDFISYVLVHHHLFQDDAESVKGSVVWASKRIEFPDDALLSSLREAVHDPREAPVVGHPLMDRDDEQRRAEEFFRDFDYDS